ncbi:MAG: TPM domain-containing protein [Sphingobacteriales bacterium]|uniref:TPM domain-containing protein n=1 Tax=Hydrotalea flava TaxID=714549 RepID=UPI000833D479|nr:TPM domain-containing protein [Hydrotalea flava]RTL48591.1 MAG: TPM domain-containing protein [Sphingobacteriales bacterium]
MGIFSKKKPVDFFSQEEKDQIVAAIQKAELVTSGEIRVYIENTCPNSNPVERAKELFTQLNMHDTRERNGVLVYVAVKSRKLAVFGDEGIHVKVGQNFWEDAVQKMISHFNAQHFAEGIAIIIAQIGSALQLHFPFNKQTDTNELPDDIVFGD